MTLILPRGRPSPVAPTLVGSGVDTTATTALSSTVTNATQDGDTIVVCVSARAASSIAPGSAPTDTKGNTYTFVSGSYNQLLATYIYVAFATKGLTTSDTLSVVWNASTSSAKSMVVSRIPATAKARGRNSNPYDNFGGTSGITGTSGRTAGSVSSISPSTIYIGAISLQNGGTFTTTTGTAITSAIAGTTDQLAVGYMLLSVIGGVGNYAGTIGTTSPYNGASWIIMLDEDRGGASPCMTPAVLTPAAIF